MFVLHIDLTVAEGQQDALGQTWRERFYPAVSAQAGFLGAELLKPVEAGAAYCVVLVFDAQASQQAWVATDLHQEVWPLVAAHCAEFAVRAYNTV